MTKSILLVGVGGQGTILAGKLLTSGLMQGGFDVKMSEIHGMSQRGGSVSTHVRYGERVESPVIEIGGADILVAFEKMEALRWLSYLKPDGVSVINDYEINPMPVISGKVEYSTEILQEIEARTRVLAVKAFEKSVTLGSHRVMNVMLLGAAVELMDIKNIDWESIIKAEVKPAFIELNLRAFREGALLAK